MHYAGKCTEKGFTTQSVIADETFLHLAKYFNEQSVIQSD